MDYFERLESETLKLYEIANEARSKGFDVELETEIPLAKDLAERVEGLVGPKGIAKRIKELEKDMSREEVRLHLKLLLKSHLRNQMKQVLSLRLKNRLLQTKDLEPL